MASPTKIPRVENESETADPSKHSVSDLHDNICNFSKFKVDKVLSNNTNRKLICLKGIFEGTDGDALILLEKTAFSENNFKEGSEYLSDKNYLKKVFRNDVYGDYQYFPQVELNALKATVIHPASKKHIEKYSVHNIYMVNETKHVYEEIILPQLSIGQLNLQWVYNILNHTSESDRIVFEDPDPETGFILLPDLKWSGAIDSLYLLAICYKKNIKSIRDLTKDHLPLLRNILLKGSETISTKYGLDESQLRIFFHYQPSFYHLHVHFTYLRHEAPGILVERAHLLSTVINNIELLPNYYQEATLNYVVRENETLFKALEEKKILKQIEGTS